MDNKLSRLIDTVIKNATDDSENSHQLVNDLFSYFRDTDQENEQYLGDVLDALQLSGEKGNDFAKLLYSRLVNDGYDVLTREHKLLGIRFGDQCGYLIGVYISAEILRDDEFRPDGYLYNDKNGMLNRIILFGPDYALRDAADRYQFVIDSFEPGEDGGYPRWVLDAAIEAASLYLNERGFGPGIPIEDWYEEKALSNLNLVLEEGGEKDIARAASLKGAYYLGKNRDSEAADCFVLAIENNPDSVCEFCHEHMHDREAYERVLSVCEAASNRMSPEGLEGLKAFPYCWNNWH